MAAKLDCVTCGACCLNPDENRAEGYLWYLEVRDTKLLEKPALVKKHVVYDPDGVPRRTFSDMFFAEVRPFEEVFRPDQSGAAENGGQSGNQNGSQGAAGKERVRLAELQKQIVLATWNLQREKVGASKARQP